jgi:pimeloyl-ACP methyl ester carboxylesterase
MGDVGYRSVWTNARDGLRLHTRVYGPDQAPGLPVVCLSGLARNAADFHELASALATGERGRRVLALDYRGRGRSDYAPDPAQYAIPVEADDVLQVLAAEGVSEAVFVGTSRGGLVTMALAVQHPPLVRGAVLNDIGPVIETRGLVRIKGYVGKLPLPRTFDEATEILRTRFLEQFPRFSEADWQAVARATWREHEGGLALDYDPALSTTMDSFDPEVPVPPFWPLFEGLKHVPVLAIRGGHSDLLSAETLEAMAAAHPGLETLVVPDEGHAPRLREPFVITAIARLVGRAEAHKPAPSADDVRPEEEGLTSRQSVQPMTQPAT